MVFRYLTAGGVGGGSRGYDADTIAWYNAVVAAGGGVSGARMALVDALIFDLKACGAWARTDDYVIYAAESEIQGLVTLKRRLTHVAFNSPSFAANQGFQGNGSNQHINTSWSYGAGGQQYTQNDARYGFWMHTASTAGHVMGTDNLYATWIQEAVLMRFGINGTAAGNYDSYAHGGNTTGWFTAERTAAAVTACYRNNVVQTTGTRASAAPEAFPAYVLGASRANNGPVIGPSNGRVAMAFYGASLSSGQAAGEYDAVRAFMTAIGVP
jgi:hypothetical protein